MSANPELLFDVGQSAGFAGAASSAKPDLHVGLARSEEEVQAAQRLRYRMFAEEMRAHLHSDVAGLDVDPFDAFCRHLIVRDRRNDEVVACMRVLLDEDAKRAGSFYSETEFHLGGLVTGPGRVMEIGRATTTPRWGRSAPTCATWCATPSTPSSATT